MLGFIIAALPLLACPSVQLGPQDLGGYPPLQGYEVTVPSANAGARELIPVATEDQDDACSAVVACNGSYWSYQGLSCGPRTDECRPVVWTVYNLGGWAPLGGQVDLGRGFDGETRNFEASASDGRRCDIQATCVQSQWRPSFDACPPSWRLMR